jgi:hypothetical protein
MPSSEKNGLAEAERRIAETKRTGETALNLSGLDLEVLPESVCRLPRLRSLYLNNNRLTQLPESIGRLAQLQKLSLVLNRLNKLPRCIERFARLELLRVSHNQLTHLPEWIGQLARLHRLHLNSNRLTRLPESIGQLSQLEELYVHRNQLTQLPESICQLAQLRKLYLHGNEALNIPAEELGPTRREVRGKNGSLKPPQEILDYYFRAHDYSRRPIDDTKLIRAPGRRHDAEIKAKTICFVVVYFGKWPIWFPAFLHSCKYNPTVNWIIFTDCGSPARFPANVVFYDRTLAQMKEIIKKKIGKDAALEDAYKMCDYKPAFGTLFDDYLKDYDFWGHCDIDIIWGDIRKYATPEILGKYDIFSTRKRMIAGHFSLFRNTLRINTLFRRSSEFAAVMRQVACLAFDEEGMTRLVAPLARAGSIRVYWPKFLQNYADPKTDTPSTLPQYVNKYIWRNGKLFDCTGGRAAEILYLHFMTWKKTLTGCELSYGAGPERFYISYFAISREPVSTPEGLEIAPKRHR